MNADLKKAVLLNDVRGVRNLLEKSVDINGSDCQSTTILHLAAFFGNDSIVHLLTEAHARIDARDNQWFTPLQRACFRNKAEVVKMLLSRGAAASNAAKQFMTPLHVCARYSSIQCAELIIKSCPSAVDRADWGGNSPLHYATYFGHLEFMELLLNSNAGVNARNKQGLTAAHWASYSGCCEALELLYHWKADLRVRDQNAKNTMHYAAISGNVKCINFLLEYTGLPIDCQCAAGYTSLHYAVLNGRTRAAELLIERGASLIIPTSVGKLIPLHIAAGITEGTACCELLLKMDLDINYRALDGSTALHFACEYGRIARTKSLIALGAQINATTRCGVTPLHIAARHGHDLIVKHLLSNGADPDLQTKSGHTAAHLAAFNGYVNVIRSLHRADANITASDLLGRTLLHVATQSASSNSEFVIDYLLSQTSIPATQIDMNGSTALHYASRSGFFNAIQKLINAGVSACARDKFGFTPLHYAVQTPTDLSTISTKILIRSDSKCAISRDKMGFLPIHYAVKAGNLETTVMLIDSMQMKLVPTSYHPYQLTVYHVSARYNHAQLLQKLLAAYHMRSLKLDPEQSTEIGYTIGLEEDSSQRIPLHYAMSYGHQRCVDVLLRTAIRNRALIYKDCNGFTPLHAAAACGRTACITIATKVLDQRNVNVVDNALRSPLMLAISNGFLECVLALLPKSDATLVDRNGRGLMHRACSLRNELLCKQLIEKNADFLTGDCNNVTPLHIAARTGEPAIVSFLLKKGAKETADSTGLTPFDWAAVEGNTECMRVLYEADTCANRGLALILAASAGRLEACKMLLRIDPSYVKKTDARGRTALHHAAHLDNAAVSATLSDFSADPSAKDDMLVTPLMVAAGCSQPESAEEIVGMFLDHGASIDDRDTEGNSAIHHACYAGNAAAARLLLSRVSIPDEDKQRESILNAQNNKNETVLHLACRKGMLDFLHDAIRISSYSLTLMDEHGRVPLVAAIDNENVVECMLYMLDHYAQTPDKAGFLLACREFRRLYPTGQADGAFY